MMLPDNPTPEEVALLRYRAALHAMQTGVRILLELGKLEEGTAKHTRVGINSAMCDTGALATLLMSKGLFTRLMETEAEKYRRRVQDTVPPGLTVTLE